MQALAEFAGKAYGNNADFRSSQLSGSLKMGNYYNHDFIVTKNNKLTLQTVELPAKIIPGKLQVSGKGAGCALIQVKFKNWALVWNKSFTPRSKSSILKNCGRVSIFSFERGRTSKRQMSLPW